jgi:hypothetical protein
VCLDAGRVQFPVARIHRPLLADRRPASTARAGRLSTGKPTPVSPSDASHSRSAAATSLAAVLRPTSVGAPRISIGPLGPT